VNHLVQPLAVVIRFRWETHYTSDLAASGGVVIPWPSADGPGSLSSDASFRRS
jgi:hypothetical protein